MPCARVRGFVEWSIAQALPCIYHSRIEATNVRPAPVMSGW
jgi:hypothetical protein